MNWAHSLRRWTMKSIQAAILGSALLGSAGIASAQGNASSASKLPNVHHTRSQTFNLPVMMDKNDRLSLSEIRLYVKTPNTPWTLHERGSNELTHFSCRVTQDGEFWYTLALVDRSGRQTPGDVNMEAPNQRVIVDTTAPVIQVAPWQDAGDFCLRCTVQDAHADYTSLKAMCGDTALEAVANQPGVFRVKSGEQMRLPVTVSVRDMAGNVGTKEVNVREMIAAMMPAKGPVAQAGNTEGNKVAPLPPPPIGDLPKQVENKINHLDFPNPPIVKTPGNPGAVEAPVQSSATQIINTTRASVDYKFDQVGPSGVGRVEIWMTPDRGQSWHRLAEQTGKRSPADIEFPGDGTYGIRVVAANGNGFGGKAPARGEAAHYTIEVDSTAPFVQLQAAELNTSTAQVEIRWKATDKNLGTEPVTLSYRTRADGPWQIIAKGVKNDGVHRWAFPRDAGGQFFFKIEVADMAGNRGHATSSTATLIDMAEPRATVLGVTGVSVTPRP